MTTLEELTAIRAIEVLKAGYCRTIDRKDWDGLGALFTVDARLHHGDHTIVGRAAIVAVISSTIGDALTSHSRAHAGHRDHRHDDRDRQLGRDLHARGGPRRVRRVRRDLHAR